MPTDLRHHLGRIGEDLALAHFERLFLPAVDGYVGRLGLADAVVDDVRQELRIRLLVGEDPRIGQYSGRGPLAAWVRMAAIRTSARRKTTRYQAFWGVLQGDCRGGVDT